MKKFFKYLFTTLYKNDAVVDAGKNQPWWQAVIIFLFAVFISILPTFTTTWMQDGSNFLKGTSNNIYGIDDGLVSFSTFIETKGLSFEIDNSANSMKLKESEGLTALQTWNKSIKEDSASVVYPLPYEYKLYVSEDPGSKEMVIFQAYDFTSYKYQNAIEQNIVNILQGDELIADQDYGTPTKSSDVKVTVGPSFLIFTSNGFALYKLPHKAASTSSTYSYTTIGGDYKNLKTRDTNPTYITSLSTVKTFDDWCNFISDGYISNKNYICAFQTSILIAVNAGIVILMGCLMWVMTRGKNNPFRIMKFYECLLMSFWASLAPAVVGLVLGYMVSSFATIIFVMIYGIRIMFLSMKQLRPAQS